MKTVYKYPTGEVMMPKGAKVLAAWCQNGEVQIWAEVDDKAPLEERHFVVYGTGWEIATDRNLSYIGTVHDGAFVWHVYEVCM